MLFGRLAQLVEHPLDVREVTGSSPVSSTKQKPCSRYGYGVFCCVLSKLSPPIGCTISGQSWGTWGQNWGHGFGLYDRKKRGPPPFCRGPPEYMAYPIEKEKG